MTADSPQQIITRAERAYQAGQHKEAIALYKQAKDLFVADGEPVRVAEMANNLSVVLLQTGDAQAAFDLCSGTDETFAEAGDIHKQALALGNQAAALEALNLPEDALTRFRQCADLLKQTGDQEYRAYVLKSISALQIRTGHQLEGLASMEAALTNKKQLSFKERILKKIIQIPFQMLNRR